VEEEKQRADVCFRSLCRIAAYNLVSGVHETQDFPGSPSGSDHVDAELAMLIPNQLSKPQSIHYFSCLLICVSNPEWNGIVLKENKDYCHIFRVNYNKTNQPCFVMAYTVIPGERLPQ
jgi:hypothetical protein